MISKKWRHIYLVTAAVIILLAAAVSIFFYINSEADKEKSYSGAKFVSMDGIDRWSLWRT